MRHDGAGHLPALPDRPSRSSRAAGRLPCLARRPTSTRDLFLLFIGGALLRDPGPCFLEERGGLRAIPRVWLRSCYGSPIGARQRVRSGYTLTSPSTDSSMQYRRHMYTASCVDSCGVYKMSLLARTTLRTISGYMYSKATLKRLLPQLITDRSDPSERHRGLTDSLFHLRQRERHCPLI